MTKNSTGPCSLARKEESEKSDAAQNNEEIVIYGEMADCECECVCAEKREKREKSDVSSRAGTPATPSTAS